jgi:hypothetical protein
MALLDLQGMEQPAGRGGHSGHGGGGGGGGSNSPSDLSVLLCHTSTISVILC